MWLTENIRNISRCLNMIVCFYRSSILPAVRKDLKSSR